MPYNSLLKDHFYIKIIILFVFNNYKKPIRNQRITDIVLEEFEIDYFDFQKCLYDLLSISLVRVRFTRFLFLYPRITSSTRDKSKIL